MIGNETLAQEARDIASGINFELEEPEMPKGWRFLGMGAFRIALLGPDNVVYKVLHYTSNLWTENEMEYLNFIEYGTRLVQHTKGRARLAECDYFSDVNVLAMEYVPKSADALNPEWDWWTDGEAGKYMSRDAKLLCGLASMFAGINDQSSYNCWFDSNNVLTFVDYTH